MDCDDSDFQSQNFQIIGEDNDGFPQSLHSYDPPKFDIDDHFQSHLRFDSLAESRLFLGIQGEENNWIEEFSPRHSSVGFGSSSSQICSITGNDVWSNTPSEIAQMLVKSIGDNEVNPQNMNTGSETHAIEDSAKNTLGLNEDTATANQHGVSLQTTNDETSESVLNINSSDQKYHSVGEVVASESTVNEELSSSSIEIPKASLVADELLEVVQSKDQLDDSSVISSFVDCGYAINQSSEMNPISVQSNIQNHPLPLLTDNASTETSKPENSLITEQKKEECAAVNVNKSSKSPESENKQSDTFPNFHGEHKLNDHNFQNEALTNDICVVKDSSGIAPTIDSLMLPNEGSHETVLSENSGLLEAIAYQVKSLNKDLKIEDKRTTGTSQLPALADEDGKKFVEVVIEKRTQLCDIAAEPINSSALVLEESQTFCSEEQRDLDVSKRVIDDNKWKIEFSSSAQTEISAVEDDTGSQIHPLTTHNLDIMQREKIVDSECLEAFTENSDKLNGAEFTVVNKHSALLEDTENKTTLSHEKLDPLNKTVGLVAESNVDSISHLEEKDNSTHSGGSSDNDFKNHSSTTETTQLSASETQDHGIIMEIDETSIKDQAENTQLLHSEVEMIVSSIPDSHSDGKDVQVASLSVVNCVTDSEISGEPHAIADSDVKGPSVEILSDDQETTKTGEGQVAFSTGAYALSTCNSTEGENAKLASTNNSDKPKQTDIEFDTSNIGTNGLPQLPLPESNLNSCSFDSQGGKPSSYETNCGSPTVISCNEWNIAERSSTQYGERNNSLQNLSGPSLEAPKFDSFEGTVQDSKMSTLGNDGNFTFIIPLDKSDPPEDSKKDHEFISQIQSLEQRQISKEITQEHLSETIKETISNPSMSVEDKKKKASARGTRKAGISKGDADENSQEKLPKGSKRTPRSISGRASRNKTGKENVQQCLYVDSSTKSSCSPNVQKSNLPDMSTSAPPLFHQPFTDLQQIQLRAQIFVYGSLIQGVLPDEACMIPAFGGTDGGRSLWEKTWRVASERFHNQKLLTSSSEQGVSCSPLSSKVLNCSAGRRDSKTPIAAAKSSVVSFQSPFQSSSKDVLPSNITRGTYLESNQSPSPLHSYQTSQMRPYLTNSAPWFSPSPHHNSWAVPSQSSPFDSAAQHSSAITSEIAQVMPARDSSKSLAANLQLTSHGALLPRQDTPSISSSFPSQIQNKEATPAGNKNPSTRDKSRKRKKISALEEPVLNISAIQPQRDSASATSITSNLPSSLSFPLPSSSLSPNTSVGFVSTTSQAPIIPYYQILGSNSQQNVLSKETCTHIEQSKVQADSASAYAATAGKHSQTIWERMTVQKSGLALEVEGKLASAAVAAAAAASVAKAAAEVAKVASEAAIQAKLMADEAVNSSYAENVTPNTENSLDIGKSLLNLPGKDKINGLSVISAAREATRRRVEASSAAMKRAENLDAILKAAEMAAEAVSQVGTIIAMGDPLPLSISELVEAGPDDYWKRHRMSMKLDSESYSQAKKNSGLHIASDHDLYTKQSAELLPSDHNKRPNSMPPDNQKSILFEEHYEGHELQGREYIVSTATGRSPIQGSTIQTGSLVEVVPEEGGLRGAWFSAYVLDIQDGKAYVQYKDLPSAEGHDKLKEWIPLEFKGDQPPRIRVAHSIMVGIPEGTRKRRREALGNFNWAVGDRVDAWMRDGWWEGVVTEKNPGDETKLTVHFPAGGDSSVVRTWNLRPSLSWEDGQWIEWPRTKEKMTLETYEGDTPQEKRRKLGLLDNKNKEEIIEGGLNSCTSDSSKLEETNQLNLSAKDAIFSMGKNVGDGNNNDAFKVKRAGLQKDGSKVVFGVPKPGKRRKFMEVSKHYTADKIEKTERSDSIKFAKYLIPQAPQPWRNSSKADTKGKQGTTLNTRVLKSLRSQNVQTKSTVDKDKSVTSASVSNGVEVSLKTSFGTGEKSSLEVGSLPHIIGKVDVAVLGPSAQHVPTMPAPKKKSSSLEVEIGEKEKGSSVADQSSRSEVQGSENIVKRSADVIEPRRSNRRIQPTSRLLEGLQSSLLISKIPNFSHDKSSKTLHKGGPSSRGQSHR